MCNILLNAAITITEKIIMLELLKQVWCLIESETPQPFFFFFLWTKHQFLFASMDITNYTFKSKVNKKEKNKVNKWFLF